jgi:uncharacterized protein with von Willebrand factor type A (vWA) domain
MFTDFFYFLRARGLKVSLEEWMSLLRAMELGLHGAGLSGFYALARAVLVKSEADYDRFDQAFAEYFKDVRTFEELPREVRDWLARPIAPRPCDQEAVDRRFAGLDLDTLRRMLANRLREQRERHDGGSHWVGTGGTSPFGNSGYNPAGIRIDGEGRHASAVQVAAQRHYRDFRQDATLDMRQFQMAFRRLRRLSSREEGPRDELRLEDTIRATCDSGGKLKLVFGRSRENAVKLLLLFDSGGSMWPYAHLCGRLFQAAHQSSHFRELRTYYFHNCVYDLLFTTPDCRDRDSVGTGALLAGLSPEWKVIVVGDGAMAVSELTAPGGCIDYWRYNRQPGLWWIRRLAGEFPALVWFNPVPRDRWTCVRGWRSLELLRREISMFPLTLEGLDEGLRHLMAPR